MPIDVTPDLNVAFGDVLLAMEAALHVDGGIRVGAAIHSRVYRPRTARTQEYDRGMEQCHDTAEYLASSWWFGCATPP
jgi:hypothetical protein